MVSILFSLLMVQMTIQSTMATGLEGRTAHYVKLLTTPETDDTAQRITCPVFSIKPANQTVKFTKYIASESQFDVVTWTERSGISTFKECAEKAIAEEDSMFMWDNGECRTTKSLFVRKTEPCNEETATLVYMIEAPETSCDDENVVRFHEDKFAAYVCKVPSEPVTKATVPAICVNGKTFTNKGTDFYYDDGTGCLTTKRESVDHTQQLSACDSDPQKLCYPKDEMEGPAHIELLKDMSHAMKLMDATSTIAIPLNYENGDWRWGISDVVQPTGEENGWRTNYPEDSSVKPFGYMTQHGLRNGDENVFSLVCCYHTK